MNQIGKEGKREERIFSRGAGIVAEHREIKLLCFAQAAQDRSGSWHDDPQVMWFDHVTNE